MTKTNTAKSATAKPSLAKASARMGKLLAPKTAKPAKAAAKSDTIATVTNDTTGRNVCVTAKGQPILVYPRHGEPKALREIAVVGGSYKAVAAFLAKNPTKDWPKPQAKLANGVDSHTAPHSAKAVSNKRAKAAPAAKAAKGKPAAKAGKNKQPSAGSDYAYKVGKKANEAKPGTWREYMLRTIMAHKSTADAKAAHAKGKQLTANKLDFNWSASQGYIVR